MSRFVPVLVALVLVLAYRPSAGAAPRQAQLSGVVNINTADEDQLTQLPGIGEKKARLIIAERQKRKFASTDQLMRVKGIGLRTYRRLKPHLAVSGATTIERAGATKKAEPPGSLDPGGLVGPPRPEELAAQEAVSTR